MIQNMPKASIPIPAGGMYQEWSCLSALVKEEPEHNDKYVTLVCVTSESNDGENDKTLPSNPSICTITARMVGAHS